MQNLLNDELPNPTIFAGRKTTHDFLSLCGHSNIHEDPRPTSQGTIYILINTLFYEILLKKIFPKKSKFLLSSFFCLKLFYLHSFIPFMDPENVQIFYPKKFVICLEIMVKNKEISFLML